MACLWPLLLALPLPALASQGVPSSDFVNRFPHLHPPTDYNLRGDDSPPRTISSITSIKLNGTDSIDISCGTDLVKVMFYRDDIIRIWLGWGGAFSDPASEDIVVVKPSLTVSANIVDKSEYYELRASATSEVVLRASKSPLLFSMYRAGVQLWAEKQGMTSNSTASLQTLAQRSDEFYFGGGMQNGRFSHKGNRIRISADDSWDDGSNPNAAPFFLSTAGYAVYRNTWAPGYYGFTGPDKVVLAHNESRFDAFFFAAAPRNFPALLEGYTYVTGRPFMPPIYGLGLGDSDCYHNERHGDDTRVAVSVADEYKANDIPAAWLLVNDGYGCGYGVGPQKFPINFTTLDSVVADLHKRDLITGLWSSTGLPNISREVAGSGTRVAKTDVGWIGAGYKYAFDAVKLVAAGIEDNSNARRFIWTVVGWAGTQRLAVMWTGDDSGSFDYIRWQIPTYVGTGFSAQAHVSGDIDGIFGGSPETYVRDLQFKCFMTTIMVMSGWAANPDKQPWTWGEPYTSINRQYLKLKLSLTPYFYTLSRVAHDTGLPPVRAMALEFPNDDYTFINSTGTSQQFMAGPSFLVAPVYRPLAETEVREGIYLPAGDWVDYWNGTIFKGPVNLSAVPVPLGKLPVFVRSGAIIPTWPNLKANDGWLGLDIYPDGESSFNLYEDDGVTRNATEKGAFTWTNISCTAAPEALRKGGRVAVTINPSVGRFEGQATARAYRFRVHIPKPTQSVLLWEGSKNTTLKAVGSLAALDFAPAGWLFSNALLGGIVHVKTPSLPTNAPFRVELSTGTQYPHIFLLPCNGAKEQSFMYDHASGYVKLNSDQASCLAVGDDKDIQSGTPAVEMQPCGTQKWQLDIGSGNLHPASDSKKCVDVDAADHGAEIYACGHLQQNQRFNFTDDGSGTGHHSGTFRKIDDGTCMTVVHSPTTARAAQKALRPPVSIVI